MNRVSPDKEPFRIIRKWVDGGVPHVEYEASFWEGGSGGYIRRRDVVSKAHWRNKVSRNVSFFGELQKALGL